jgi:methionyl-tRNA formyltransferase
VLLAGPGPTTDIVANFLSARLTDLVVVMEEPASRVQLARRRAQRVGWTRAIGQVLFVAVALPWLRRRGRRRCCSILAETGLDATPFYPVRRVSSVNAPETAILLQQLRPSVVVVNGTRIISEPILCSVKCPFINTHAGITPRYRGVHGAYWALAEGRPDEVGTTIHLVDRGIDTGAVLAQARFGVMSEDSVATYPFLHLAAGLPLLMSQLERVLTGKALATTEGDPGESRLYMHPTLWTYVRQRITRGVR